MRNYRQGWSRANSPVVGVSNTDGSPSPSSNSNLCQNVLLNRFIRGKRLKSQGAKSGRVMVGDQTPPIENAIGASLLQLQCATEDLSWRRTIPEDNILRRVFWIKELNYSMHSTFGGRLYCFRHVYELTTRSELISAMCRDRRAY